MRLPGPYSSIIRSITLALAIALVLPAQALAASSTVREPAFSLPHFYGDTDAEMARENGREIAKDRLVQIILLSRVGRGTLHQALGALDPGLLNDDISARSTGYTSSELNNMYAKFPQRERDLTLAYCEGVNDTIEEIYAGTLPEPIEINILRNPAVGIEIGDDLFGNATNISDQVDPFYKAPGGADPERPNAGFQYTPEVVMSIAVLEARNFGFESFNEASRLNELQALIAEHGSPAGDDIFGDLNFLNDPLAPVSVPDSTTPGYGGPLASLPKPSPTKLASATKDAQSEPSRLAALAKHYPRYDYAGSEARRREAAERRAAVATRLGAWPKLGSYAWMIAGNRSATGNPWVGGFPQTGIQTPSIMHFAENRSGEGIQGIGMQFAGLPVILIGQTDSVAYTTTTAQLRVVDTFFEEIIGEDADAIRYSDEGTPAPLSPRTEIFRSDSDLSHVFWRSHERNGNGGSRPILYFQGDAEGTAESGDPNQIVDDQASFDGSFAGGHVAIIDGTGVGQIRAISAVPSATTLEVGTAWTTPPDDTSVYVATKPGDDIIAVAWDSAPWLEETTTALGFSRYQQATDVLDIREGARLIPSTHNFISADNQTFNTIGTNPAPGSGNIAYYSSGFSRVRQGAEDKLLPLDGTASNPLVVVSGTVDSASTTTLQSTGSFTGHNFTAPAYNFRYDNPTLQGSEYIVSITSGTGYKQTRRIASNTDDTLTLEYEWGVTPDPNDTFEVYEIVAMPEAINPSEGYSANWNNKAATADDGSGFGRNHLVAFILERLAAESAWDRDKQRQLNKDLAGHELKLGRYLVPRLREAVDDDPNDVVPEAHTVLAALEAHNGSPEFGRHFIDPLTATTTAGEYSFLNSLISQLANDIYGDEFSDTGVGVPGGSRALAMVIHAIDSAAGDVPGSYSQKYGGDYFNGTDWKQVVRNSLSALAPGGIPADLDRPDETYKHPLSDLFPELEFPPTPLGNRGTWEQIVEVGPVVKGEFIFPLGQSGHIEGSLTGVTFIDPHNTTLHPIWRDWRFFPMLHVSQDLAGGGDGDLDDDGVLDGFERWYFGDTSPDPADDGDADGATLIAEYLAGADPTDSDTDDDGLSDGEELALGANPQSRDTDGDGVLDPDDNCPTVENDGQEDADDDGIGDACELAPAVQEKAQQKCIVTLNKNFAKVTKTQGKENNACIKNESKDKLGAQTLEECLTADSKGKVADAQAKTVSKAGKDCDPNDPPDFGATDADTVNQAAIEKELSLITAIFGTDLDAVIVKQADDKDVAKCQVSLAKAAQKCQDTKLKEFNKCKKNGLKGQTDPLKIPDPNDVPFVDDNAIADCMGFDGKGQIDKACNTKLLSTLQGKCTGIAITIVDLVPGECSTAADLPALRECLDRLVSCAMCQGLEQADALPVNCDEFDDGVENGSCGAGP